MGPTLPFWVGALILIFPATIMILAVVGALPSWFGLLLFVVLFGLPVPAAAWTIGIGIQALRERPPGEPLGQVRPFDWLRSGWSSISALVSILLSLVVMTGALTLLGWFLLNLDVRLRD
ncbi:hypothetical protein [Tautonia marina]|uniref:hypothetical protein n=1 Tax=Tautonia marina TaxID=2653855 RepID=UPI001260D46F|nr:hypothetical protein [Tautonia marina]